MGQLVFQATLGGQVNLVGPNTASTFNINVPAVAGNMVTTGDTGTVTNTMLAGSIANAKLTNSSVTIGSTSVSLGATAATVAGLTLTTPVINGFTGDTSIVNIGSGQFYKDTSGNVGIGTSSPSSYGQFAVVGNSTGNIYQATFANLNTGSNTTKQVSACWFLADTGGTSKRVASILAYPDNANVLTGGMTFNVRKTDSDVSEAARIDSSGSLLVGTTSATFGGVTLAQILDARTRNSGYGLGVIGNASNTQIQRFFYDTTAVGSINVSGSATTYSTSSDYRLKENVTPMVGALEKVSQLKPCTYTWKVDGSNGHGFIAHELQEVVPECVVGEKDAVSTYLDEDGNEQTSPVYQGIDTSFLVATLTAAIQELKAIVDTQAQAITTLTKRITALEAPKV